MVKRKVVKKKARRKVSKTAAILTIQAPGKMTREGRNDIAKWLLGRARFLINPNALFTEGRFVAKYFYT